MVKSMRGKRCGAITVGLRLDKPADIREIFNLAEW